MIGDESGARASFVILMLGGLAASATERTIDERSIDASTRKVAPIALKNMPKPKPNKPQRAQDSDALPFKRTEPTPQKNAPASDWSGAYGGFQGGADSR